MTTLSLRMSLASNLRNSVSFSPALLFAGGQQGAWYDPSDRATLFQDRFGTTPVTASGQPVGLMLDKSQGLVSGPELVADNDNEAQVMRNIQGTAVTGTNGTVTQSTDRAQSGNNSAKFTATSDANTSHYVVLGNIPAGVSVKIEGWVYVPSGGMARCAAVDTSNGSMVENLTNVRDAWARFSIIRPSVAATWPLAFGNPDAESILGYSFYLDNISIRALPGNHATQATASKRPTYTEGSGLSWLAFDGADDAMQTAAIDFTGADKVSVFAGVRKLSDAATGVIAEISADASTTNKSFSLYKSASLTINGAGFISRGTEIRSASATEGLSPPANGVLTGLGDISGDRSLIRINGVQRAINSLEQGSGNYGNYPLFIGARAGTSLYFNGNLYGLIIAGKLASSPEITSSESYLAQKSGLTL